MKTRTVITMALITLLLVACNTSDEASLQPSDEMIATAAAEILTAEAQNQPTQEQVAVIEPSNSPTIILESRDGIQLQQVLAVGIIRLDDSAFSITSKQAQEQIILWKTIISITEADNVTAEEIDSIYAQIQETLTIDQIRAINAMDLSFEDMSETIPDLEFGQAGGFGDLTPEEQATRQAQRESEDFTPPEGFTPGQGGPGGGQGFGGGQAPPDGVIPGGGNVDAEGVLNRFDTDLINEVISFLEVRASQ